MDSSADRGWGVARTFGQVCASVLQGLLLRLDLLKLELKEERARLIGLFVLGLLVALSAFMAFLVLNLTILVIAGEHRIAVLLMLLGFYLLLAVGLGVGLWRKVRSGPVPFAATVEELKKDHALFFGR